MYTRALGPSFIPGPIVWETFKIYLDDNIDLKISLKSTNEIEISAQNLIKSITDAAINSAIPTISTEMFQKIFFLYIYEKRYAGTVWQRTRMLSDKTNYNQISNKLKKLLSKYKNENYATYSNR